MMAASEKLIKNFVKPYLQVKHGQYDSITFPKNILFLKHYVIIRPLPWWQQGSLLFSGPGIYPQIYLKTPMRSCKCV